MRFHSFKKDDAVTVFQMTDGATTPKRKRRYSYDQACSDLAVYFLTDGKREIDHDSEVVKELAQAIQDVCEAHCQNFERS